MEVISKSLMDKSYKSIDQKPKDISHYGILGMKWGIRKQEGGGVARTGSPQDKSTGYEPKNPGIGEGGKPAKPGSGSRSAPKAKDMSDSELRETVNRLNMEKQYKQLTSSPQSRTIAQKGGKAVLDVLGNSAKNIATQQLTKRGNQMVDDILNKR